MAALQIAVKLLMLEIYVCPAIAFSVKNTNQAIGVVGIAHILHFLSLVVSFLIERQKGRTWPTSKIEVSKVRPFKTQFMRAARLLRYYTLV